MIFSYIIKTIKKKTFEILIAFTFIILFLYFIYCSFTKKEGTWSKKKIHEQLIIPGDDLKNESYFNRLTKPDSSGETECRRVLQKIFKKPFKKERPDFLKNYVTGGTHNLELDCFNSSLKIAVEYQGRQHYEYVPFFHNNSKIVFENGKYRDEMKRRLCSDNGIKLIEVPYFIKNNDIEEFITQKLKN